MYKFNVENQLVTDQIDSCLYLVSRCQDGLSDQRNCKSNTLANMHVQVKQTSAMPAAHAML
jgi:hypothetical protein